MKGKSRGKIEPQAPPGRVIKVWMEESLIENLDVAAKTGARAEFIRDLVADRLLPHPALVTTQRAYRACRRLEAFFDPEEWISNRYQDDPERLEELRADIRELASAVSDLQSTMAQQLLEAAGIKAPTR